jgi:hypothetical protein
MKNVVSKVICSITHFRRLGLDRIAFLAVRYFSWKLRVQRRLSQLPPWLATLIFICIRTAIQSIVSIGNCVAAKKYTDADPYKIIKINPNLVINISSPSKRRGWVVDGDWDLRDDRFLDRTIPKAIHRHFLDGIPWTETSLYTKSDSEAEFRKQTDDIERLFANIEQQGYRSQQELLSEDPMTAWRGLNDAIHPLVNEITVDIGRDGQILWSMGGQHRLAIAQILDLHSIPVQVMRRHADWQQIRSTAREEGYKTVADHRNHPDIQDILQETNQK